MGGKRTGAVRARKRANAWCLRTWAWVPGRDKAERQWTGVHLAFPFPSEGMNQVPDPGINRSRQVDPFLKRPRNIKPPRFLGIQLLPRSNGVAFGGQAEVDFQTKSRG
ncbi:hypothetical protein PspLS_07667 [Pyricularia sp. CBS 133598]|nr:hypothetical protein PspLS_07667 [Pyricularia sp. CBS 133598]